MKRGAGVSSDEGSSKKPFWALGLLTAMKDPKSVRKEDDRIVVITDKYAKAEHHLLVLPKENIPHAGKLNRDHIPLLKHMEYVAKEVANEYTDHNFLFGYHAQASMARLHLHVISDDFNSPALKSKKHWNSFTTNFFIPSEEMINKIEKNGKFDQISPIRAKELLDTPLKCHKCSTTALNMPKLKQHLLIHHVKEKKSI